MNLSKHQQPHYLPLILALLIFPFVAFSALANGQNTINKIEWFIETGELAQATELLNKTDGNYRSSLAGQLYQARIHVANNKLEMAEDMLSSLLTQFPNDPSVHFWFGVTNGYLAKQASIFKAGSFAKKAKASFLQAIKLDSTFVPAHEALVQFYLEAPAIAGGSRKKAKIAAEQLVSVDPLKGHLSLLMVERENDDEEAELNIIKLLDSQHIESAEAQFVVGFYFQNKQRYDEAFIRFKRAVEANVNGSIGDKTSQLGALYQLGRNAVFSERHIVQGIDAMIQYLQLDVPTSAPSKTWAKLRLSQLYILNNQPAEAKPILVALEQQSDDHSLLALLKKEMKKI